MFRTAIQKLQMIISKKYPEFRPKFYINRRNKLIHVGMDKSIFDFNNYRLFLWDCEWFLQKLLPNDIKFEFYRIPTLINCTKWKFDYICARRITN